MKDYAPFSKPIKILKNSNHSTLLSLLIIRRTASLTTTSSNSRKDLRNLFLMKFTCKFHGKTGLNVVVRNSITMVYAMNFLWHQRPLLMLLNYLLKKLKFFSRIISSVKVSDLMTTLLDRPLVITLKTARIRTLMTRSTASQEHSAGPLIRVVLQ